MRQKIYITGIGIVSALGRGVEKTFTALKNEKSGIRPIAHLESKNRGKFPGGEVPWSNGELATIQNMKHPRAQSRTMLLGLMAAREAWNFSVEHDNDRRVGIISSTSVGGIDRSELVYKTFLEERSLAGILKEMASHDCGDSTEKIADYLGIYGYLSTVSTACSSASNAMITGARMIKAGLLDKVLVGGTDALTIYTLNGFNSLKILDTQWCRPFDQNRNGLNLGEGAAYLTLESEESIQRSGRKPICEFRGYGNANDAFHQTASSPEGRGAHQAMRLALDMAELNVADIDYINAHGTATENNDLSEGRAIKQLFGMNIPPFSSTKSYTGHTLAAAGAIEAVLSILLLKNKCLAPNLNFRIPIPELNISPVSTFTADYQLNHVLSNSFGFGGNCSSLLFSEIE